MRGNLPKLAFLGTPYFAVPTLLGLIEHGYSPEVVFTQPDKPAGRGKNPSTPPVKRAAYDHGLTVIQVTDAQALGEVIRKHQVDICILVAFGMIIPDRLLKLPHYGFLNIHPSLLPKYRGATPIQAAILHGDAYTGISIIELTPHLDAGPVVAQKRLAIKPTDTAQTLHDTLAQLGAQLLLDTLTAYLDGQITPRPQQENLATYTHELLRADGRINWQKKASDITRQFRAYYSWPGSFTFFGKQRLKILALRVFKGNVDKRQPGEVFLGPRGEILVACGEDAVELLSLQLEGKKEVDAGVFSHGHGQLFGSIFDVP